MTATRSALLTATLLLAAGTAAAQTDPTPGPVYYESSPGVYTQVPPAAPGPVYAPPAYPPAAAPAVTRQYPRLYRALEVLSEPSLLLGKQPRPGYTPTPYPFLDAAPYAANLTFTGLYFAGITPLGGFSFLVAPALRATRVGLYGTPYPMTQRETRLWVAQPLLVPASRNKYATGYYLNRPLYQRLGMSGPLFPALHTPGTDFLGRPR